MVITTGAIRYATYHFLLVAYCYMFFFYLAPFRR